MTYQTEDTFTLSEFEVSVISNLRESLRGIPTRLLKARDLSATIFPSRSLSQKTNSRNTWVSLFKSLD